MSDRGYAFVVALGKYVAINLLTFFAILFFVNQGWISEDDSILIIHVIVNAAAVIHGKLQQVLDRINELHPAKNDEEN